MGRYDFISAAFYNEVKNEVEEKLRKQQLTKPLTQKEMATFCEAMVRNLELKPGALSEVRRWAQAWHSAQFGSHRA